jgi:hypothetical protein
VPSFASCTPAVLLFTPSILPPFPPSTPGTRPTLGPSACRMIHRETLSLSHKP